jgi:hypothetical protein
MRSLRGRRALSRERAALARRPPRSSLTPAAPRLKLACHGRRRLSSASRRRRFPVALSSQPRMMRAADQLRAPGQHRPLRPRVRAARCRPTNRESEDGDQERDQVRGEEGEAGPRGEREAVLHGGRAAPPSSRSARRTRASPGPSTSTCWTATSSSSRPSRRRRRRSSLASTKAAVPPGRPRRLLVQPRPSLPRRRTRGTGAATPGSAAPLAPWRSVKTPRRLTHRGPGGRSWTPAPLPRDPPPWSL